MTRRLAAFPLVALLAAALATPAPAARDPIDLLNLALSPELATWLVGPNARIATKEEVKEYLALTSDEAARAFIERFWEKRDPDPVRPGNPVLSLADERAAEADRRFGEVDTPGRRSDRGTIFVLYGEPEKIDHEPGDFKGDPPLEVWSYPAGAERGLDGERPARRYRFVEENGEVVLYQPGLRRTRLPTAANPF